MGDARGAALAKLGLDFLELSRATGAFGWNRDDQELTLVDPSQLAKPIPKDVWNRAFVITLGLHRDLPSHVPLPIPGADPEGFVWLTWKSPDERRGLALELRDGLFKWTHSAPHLEKKTIQSDSLNDVTEALRTVFEGYVIN